VTIAEVATDSITSKRHSIRVNDQWRICFTWTKEGPANVEIVDYH